MIRLHRIAATVLVAFVATTAVPGSGVVTHRHAGGEHEHAHAFFGHDHDGYAIIAGTRTVPRAAPTTTRACPMPA